MVCTVFLIVSPENAPDNKLDINGVILDFSFWKQLTGQCLLPCFKNLKPN